eukprot:m.39276 g.39276  ORF g.39276 m.39276 type:complete len:64 (+) comp10281_c0_seq2:2131-2322(+)
MCVCVLQDMYLESWSVLIWRVNPSKAGRKFESSRRADTMSPKRVALVAVGSLFREWMQDMHMR